MHQTPEPCTTATSLCAGKAPSSVAQHQAPGSKTTKYQAGDPPEPQTRLHSTIPLGSHQEPCFKIKMQDVDKQTGRGVALHNTPPETKFNHRIQLQSLQQTLARNTDQSNQL
ncbi:hypothetical protein ILYODFUR_038694 [Ilyodon furcidens]|uniref:Prolactin receptor n=1 Tax=Ilyodon furcidens TaxID=33524 RepID=A0ABV0VD20_9TELE